MADVGSVSTRRAKGRVPAAAPKVARAGQRRLEGIARRLQPLGLDVHYDPLALDTPVRELEDPVDRRAWSEDRERAPSISDEFIVSSSTNIK